MTTSLARILAVSLFVVFFGNVARATDSYPCHITSLVTGEDQKVNVFTDLDSSHLISCGGSCTATSQFYVYNTNPTNSSLPSYATLSPYLMAAFLYNKTVIITVSGCNGWCLPVVTAINVEQ